MKEENKSVSESLDRLSVRAKAVMPELEINRMTDPDAPMLLVGPGYVLTTTMRAMNKMKAKVRNLQPWLDYFGMLQEYERNGYLDVMPEKGEAYVTRAALMTLAGVSLSASENGDGIDMPYVRRAVARVVRRVRVYSGWRRQDGVAYLDRAFALHVVKEAEPHDLLYTVLLSRRRRWWKLWMKAECMDIITY